MTDHKTVREALEKIHFESKIGIVRPPAVALVTVLNHLHDISAQALAALDRIEATTAEKNKAALDAIERIHASSLGRKFYNGVTDDFYTVCAALTTPSVPQEK